MAGELDVRLIGLLKATLGLVDALHDMGGAQRVAVKLDRAAGLPHPEDFSVPQDRRP